MSSDGRERDSKYMDHFLSCSIIAYCRKPAAEIAQLGERQTEDLKVPGSIPGLGIIFTASKFPSLLVCKPCGA